MFHLHLAPQADLIRWRSELMRNYLRETMCASPGKEKPDARILGRYRITQNCQDARIWCVRKLQHVV